MLRNASKVKPKRPDQLQRRSNNDKRRLQRHPDPDIIQILRKNIRYEGSSKHKGFPKLYGLEPFQGKRGDATLCDRDAGFLPQKYSVIKNLLQRGLQVGLISESGRIIWTVAEDGWIFEARLTNAVQTLYHGYPIRRNEQIAEVVYQRFRKWAQSNGNQFALQAANQCKTRYGFK